MKSALRIPSETPWRVLIVDDEPTARRGIRLLLDQCDGTTIVGEAASGDEAIKDIVELKPDLVFLDVQMPGPNGFEVIQRVGPAGAPAVIFVTAYDEYALRAFEVNAVDYLLKPYEDERFFAAVGRAQAALRQRRNERGDERLARLLAFVEKHGPADAVDENAEALADRILVKSSGEIIFLKPDEIDWIEAEGDYMVFHVGGKTHLMRETMARLEARLDGKRFVRIHRSTIVNIDRVRKLSPAFLGEYAVVLQDGTKLRLSRGYQERLQTWLKNAL
jgi:two-component system LytT family response regulator